MPKNSAGNAAEIVTGTKRPRYFMLQCTISPSRSTGFMCITSKLHLKLYRRLKNVAISPKYRFSSLMQGVKPVSNADDRSSEPDRATLPSERQCAMLLAHLLMTKQAEQDRELTRARLSEITLRRLFGRQRLTPTFLLNVQEWLFHAGWTLFAAGATYAVVKTKVVDGWRRASSKGIAPALKDVRRGKFNFDSLEHLLTSAEPSANDDE